MSTDFNFSFILFFCFSCFYTKTDSQFIETPINELIKCSGNSVNIRWNHVTTNIISIKWYYYSTLMMSRTQTNDPVYHNNYDNSTLEFVADAEILLKTLTTSSTGNYSCTLTYFSGSILNTTSLTVYDTFASNLSCLYSGGLITCTKPDASVSLNATDGQGMVFSMDKKPLESGNYTICMYGDALVCIGSVSPCTTVEVNIQGAPSNPKNSCGLYPLWCFLSSIFGSLKSILLYKCCIQRNYWKTVLPVLVVVIVVCQIATPIVCHYECFDNGFWSALLAWFVSFLLTLLGIVIGHNYEKLKGNKDKPNITPILGNKDKPNITPILGTADKPKQSTTLGTADKPEQSTTLDTTEEKDQNRTPVPSEKVMLLVKAVDKGISSACEWISEQGNLSKDRDRNKLKYSFGSSLKVSLVINSLSKEDNGIYQCVRTLPHEVKDKINVVLCVSNTSPICLVVNPFVWEDQMFEDLSPVDLKKIVTKFDRNSLNEVIRTLNSQDGRNPDYVDWTCSSKPNEKGKSKEINGSTILSAADAGEYRCTLHLNKKTYVFIFYIHYLDKKDSRPQTNEHVFGVPSMLNSNREESKAERKQKTRHTATSDGIHKEPIEDQMTDLQLPHTIHKKTQQHDTP